MKTQQVDFFYNLTEKNIIKNIQMGPKIVLKGYKQRLVHILS